MRPLNTDAFLYVKLTAQQVDDERTTAVVRFMIVTFPTTYTISSNNLSYISQQLIPVLSTPMSMGTDDFSYSLRGIWWQ